jgi:hypothetical protein
VDFIEYHAENSGARNHGFDLTISEETPATSEMKRLSISITRERLRKLGSETVSHQQPGQLPDGQNVRRTESTNSKLDFSAVRIVKLEQKVMKTPLRSRGQRMDY